MRSHADSHPVELIGARGALLTGCLPETHACDGVCADLCEPRADATYAAFSINRNEEEDYG
jgi:hypothetical protein